MNIKCRLMWAVLQCCIVSAILWPLTITGILLIKLIEPLANYYINRIANVQRLLKIDNVKAPKNS